MKTLVIAEKPDMGRNIAAVIEPRAKNNRSYLEGEQYIITWAIGHLVGLAEPDAYDPKYKRWNIRDLPIIPEQFRIVPNPKTKDQLKVIGDLAKRCDHIVNACDAGREGQYIFALIQQQLGLHQPVKRLWISDLTAESIKQGFAQLKDGSEFESLTLAARARSEADWLIGMNASRAFTTRHQTLLSVGRVQTPVLALIYDRQKEIEAFESQTFYDVKATFRQDSLEYVGTWQGDRLTSQERSERIAAKVKGKNGTISKYEVKETKEHPFKLYDLTLLQREANAKYGYSAKKTLDLAQGLYERHKVISYPRTNSNYVNEQNIEGMHKALNMLKSTPYGPMVQGADPNRVHKNNKSVCNPERVEDHHAILPTLKRPGTLSKEEQHIYDLIIIRFLSHFYPPALYKQHTVLTEVEGETFKTNIKELLSLGWKVLIQQDKDKDKERKSSKSKKGKDDEEEESQEWNDRSFDVLADKPVVCLKSEVKEKATQPPKSYTEGTLLKAMESAGKSMEDEELRDAMKDSGLGTPATRAATIERLKKVGYITMQGKKITVTQKGRTAVELIRHAGVELLASPEMTGQWERRLHQISKGEASADVFMKNVQKFTVSIIDKVSTQRPAPPSMFGDSEDGKGKGNQSSKRSRSTSETGKSASATARSTGEPESNGDPGASQAASSGVRVPLGDCPTAGCGGQIIEGRKGYGCSHFKSGCKFVIWKEFAGKSISHAMLKSLLTSGKTQLLTFKDKSGGAFKARIALNESGSGQLTVQRESTGAAT
ncbi:DNA topoisomerase 3 [Paenibacillus sp. N3/727]|uniref:type IA DNA topoisomerase n=1 Tax=Paenibacillus sp. N3/727 TaxID=2925845 RepID=UPI001F53CC87|nr:type IA DNA topoisomerase [Paenibacillus sp. N3/727]UNK20874.1 DNA topoisomerase 3 [Paenibacillus sp. N3/727]